MTQQDLTAIDEAVDRRVHESLEFSRHSPSPDPAAANDHVWAEPLHPTLPGIDPGAETVVQGYLEAVRDAIAEEMRRDQHIIYMGEGTGERGGSFAHTKGLWHEFGGERMIDTPISELGFTGAAVGSSASGCRAVADLMFVDFMFEAATQIIEQGAKMRYMSNGQLSVPVIVRASWGTVKCTGPHHSGAYHPIWAHCPGLIVVIPSNPADAKGLMKTAFRAGDPVLMLEPKALFSTKGPVPKGEYFVPFGVANIVRAGSNLSIATCGTLVHRAVEAAELLAQEGISCEVIDLRTIVPLDVETIAASVAKTGHLLVVDEAFAMCGLGAEIAAAMMELAFDELDAPVGRIHNDPTAHPFSPIHEAAVVITTEKIVAGARAVLAGRPLVPRRLHGVRPGAGSAAGHSSAATSSAGSPAPAASGSPSPAPPPKAQPKPGVGNGQSSKVASKSGVAVIMPNQDSTITEGKVIGWGKKIGDQVVKGETVAEIETDKAIIAIEAPATGRLVEIVAPVETIVALGQTIGIVEPT